MSQQSLTVPGVIESLGSVMEYVMNVGDEARLSKKAFYNLRLAIEELVTNIVLHGYQEAGLQGDITLRTHVDSHVLRIVIEDTGVAFDPKEHTTPKSLEQSLEDREVGGLGVFLALNNVDDYQYSRVEGRNRSVITFQRPPSTINRQLATNKTQQVNSMTSYYLMNLARVKSYSTKMQIALARMASDLQRYGIAPEIDVQDIIDKLDKSVSDTLHQSQMVIDQLTQFQRLLDVSGIISSSLELDTVLEIVMDTVISLTGAERAYLLLRVQETDQYNVHAARTWEGENLREDEYSISQTILGRTIDEVQPFIITDARQDKNLLSAQSVQRLDLLSILSIPLMMHGKIIGVLYADTSTKQGSFSNDLVPILTTFANQAATAIENARLFAKSRREARLERDLQIGQEIQAGFLPLQLPQVEGWMIGTYFEAARQVAGDFYDVFTLAKDKIAFVVGDVCDKGIGAAMFMALFRSLLRAFTQQHHSLSWMDDVIAGNKREKRTTLTERRVLLSSGAVGMMNAINLTNDYIANNHGDSNMFATMFFGMVDPTNGTLTYINGGHNPPLLIGADGGFKDMLGRTGPAVGMMPEMDFGISQTKMEPGDLLVCFTDGLTEARSLSGEFFTTERLVALVQENAHLPAAEVVERVRQAVTEHSAEADQFDDITLLIVQRLG